MANAKETKQQNTAKEWEKHTEKGKEWETWAGMGLTFSWLKESILLIAVSKAVMESTKAWSWSHSGLLSRSAEIFTAALDMADTHTQTHNDVKKVKHPADYKPCKWLKNR